jgi:hypothetical protein
MGAYESGIQIRDIAMPAVSDWTPPIGAMGGPPAHELYRDLVLHAGLKLYRGPSREPWIVLKDGERRRGFVVPSPELRGALDRFRMRRNLRPVAERDIDDFVRIVEARVSDPDVALPRLEEEVGGAPSFSSTHLLPGEDEVERPWVEPSAPELREVTLPVAAVSGGHTEAEDPAVTIPRYVRVLRELVRNGEWMGTTAELSERVGDDPERVFGTLIEHRIRFAEGGVVVAPVEVEEGWRWIAVDRTRVERG